MLGEKALLSGCRTDPAHRLLMRLFAYAAVLALLLAVSARAGATDEIRFRYQDGLIWLKAEIPGKNESLNFLLDSGAGVSVLDLGRARALRHQGWQFSVSAGGQRVRCRLSNRRFPGGIWGYRSPKIGVSH